MITKGGDMYMWGWNHAGQLGRPAVSDDDGEEKKSDPLLLSSSSFLEITPLSNIRVATADLGHAHTLVIEKGTGRALAFGENGRGQIDGRSGSLENPRHEEPVVPSAVADDAFVDVAAGLFHSAGVTEDGELVTWGCGRFGQCLKPSSPSLENGVASPESSNTVGRWRADDGSKFIRVACGRRHTLMLDDRGRVWSMGENKYGQLGRETSSKSSPVPAVVDGPLGLENSGCCDISSGWSHALALVRTNNNDGSSSSTSEEGATVVYGWGRNDRGQLGTGEFEHVRTPRFVHRSAGADGGATPIRNAFCGAECSHVLDVNGGVWSCGWNEHGNLGNGGVGEKCAGLTKVRGARIVAPPPAKGSGNILCAAGGAHILAIAT